MPAVGSERSRERRPHLDGLRVVAVYLVVAFHAGLARFQGGFVGVDVFFVLSGYLVTNVLRRDLDATGRVSLARFYARRVRRLLPAAVVTLLVTLIAFAGVADEVSFRQARSAAVASFVYVSNWFFIREATDYFAPAVDSNPFLHFWSLAVEEQFYLVWPVVLTALFVASRRLPGPSSRWMQGFAMSGAIISLGLALAWRNVRPDRAYFGTDARVYQLLAGALLALTPGVLTRGRRHSRVADVVAVSSLIALLVIASSAWTAGPVVRGVAACAIASSILIGIESAPDGIAARFLGLEPMAYLGRISYGTYLWHWPVIVILREVHPVSDRATFLVTTAVASGLAALSHQLLEHPVRTWKRLDRHPVPVALTGIVGALVATFLVVPNLPVPDGRPAAGGSAPGALAQYLTPVPDDFSLREVYFGNSPEFVECVGRPVSGCTAVDGSGTHIMLLGDSVMHGLVPAFESIARKHGLRLSLGTLPGCPWPEGVYVLKEKHQRRCRRIKEDLYRRVLPELRPDVVIVLDSGPNADTDVREMPRTRAATDYRAAVMRSVPVLAELAESVVIVETIPKIAPLLNPLDCLDSARYIEECRFDVPPAPGWMDLVYRGSATDLPGVITLDLDRLVCPMFPVCDPIVDGRVVWWDGQHLASEYVRSLADDIHTQLVAVGVLDS